MFDDPNDIAVMWRDLVFTGMDTDGPFKIKKLSGWLDLPGATFETQPASGHGLRPTPGVHGARLLGLDGFIRTDALNRNDCVRALRGGMIPRPSLDESTEDFAVAVAGSTSTALAQLENFSIGIDNRWGNGALIPFSATWRCPNPRVYGDWQYASAPLINNPAGVNMPVMMPFLMPAKPLGGEVWMFNPGNDPEGSPTRITLTGPQPGNVGVILATAGVKLSYGVVLGDNDQLVIDTELGGAFLNGEYRPPVGFSSVTSDLRLRPGPNVIRALGIPGPTGSPSIQVASRPASW